MVPEVGLRACVLSLAILAGCTPAARDHACDAREWGFDLDGDGFGAGDAVLSCDPVEGRVADTSDCDDADEAIHPGALEDCSRALDANCDGSVGYADADADGSPACRDCDDADATRGPDALEFCNERDDDCDGQIDEDPSDGTYRYADADGDGYGDATTSERGCTTDDGWSEVSGDCDDTDPTLSPAAAELCDGLDDDCDGAVDEVDDAPRWYTDRDGDGYGDDATLVRTCDPEEGWVGTGGDCDDLDSLVNPAAVEVCGGGDEDCDGDVDEGDAIDATAWYEDADHDGWGDPASRRMACEAPVTWIERGADCDDTLEIVSPDAVELCDGIDDDCDLVTDEDDAEDATVWFADTDGDGYAGEDVTTVACVAPSGGFASAEDCDDADATISPGGTELCDGLDDDCDGTVDEDAADALPWYVDADGDGWGDPAEVTLACDAPEATVADGTDCDDADPAISPGAAEACDGVDDDCDGTVDDGAVDATVWYVDLDADGWGEDASALASCDDPGGRISAGGDCDDDDATFHPSAAEDCAGPDTNCDGFVGTADADGDGWVACEDCDDGDATFLPGAAEICDHRDQDCDGVPDDDAADALPWYADRDGDGYGDATTPVLACELPASATDDATDCDDTDAAVSPEGTETCATSADDDCDGDANEEGAPACTAFYLDFDEDGSGSTTHACLCEAEAPFSASDSDDCDDGDPRLAPTNPEVWGNGKDDDCDGEIDLVSLAGAYATLEGQRVQDGAGTVVAAAGDADGDGLDDLLVAAPLNDGNGSLSGAAYLVLGGAEGVSSLDDAAAIFVGAAAGDEAGVGLAGADVDGDGYGDVLVGAPEQDAAYGAAYLVYGPATGTVDLATADVFLQGDSAGDEAGVTVATGDLDGDGLADLIVGGDGDDDNGSRAGAVWVMRTPVASGASLASPDAKLVGELAGDTAGGVVASGTDLDGDGIDDLLVGAPGDDASATDSGAVYLVLGPISGTIDLATNDGKYVGEYAGDHLGEVASFTPDVDGDGRPDLLLGATSYGIGGGAFLFYGPTGSFHHRLVEAVATWVASTTSDDIGVSVAGPGDLNGDGRADVAIGASGADDNATNSGAVYVYFGPVGGLLYGSDADASFYGDSASDYGGASVAAVGDANGDGVPDLLVGATGDDGAGSNAGAAYLMVGPGG